MKTCSNLYRTLWLTAWLCSGQLLYGQIDSVRAEQLMALAKGYIKNGKPDSAALYHRQVTDFYQRQNQLGAWLKSYTSLAYSLAGAAKRPVMALDWIDQSLKGQWRPPQNNREWEQLAMNYLAGSHFMRVNLADFNGAKRYLEAAEEIFRVRLGEKSHRIALYLYHHLANIYTRHGDYERAISLLRRSLQYFQRFPDSKVIDHGDLAIALTETGRFSEAMEVLRQGFAIDSLSSELKVSLYLNRADLFSKMGQTREALLDLENITALIRAMVREKGSLDEQYYLMQYHQSKAEIYSTIGQSRTATAEYLAAVKAGVAHWGTERRREIGKVYGHLGNLKLKEQNGREALVYFHRALQSVVPGFDTPEPAALPVLEAIFNENTILEALEGKAKAFVLMGQLEEALRCYELIPVVEAKLRATFAYESSALLVLRESRLRFDAAIGIAWQLYEQHRQAPSYLERAFRLSEQSRGLLLLQSLAEAQAQYRLPETLRRQEENWKSKIAWYEHEIPEERAAGSNSDPARLMRLEKELFDLKQDFEKFKTELRQQYPDYAALSDEIRFVEAGAVASLLRPGQILVDYYLTEKAAFVFTFNADGRHVWRRAMLPADFRSAVQRWVEYLHNGDEEDMPGALDFRRSAHLFYQDLLAPDLAQMLPDSGSLLIAPDDALVWMPFDVLLRAPTESPNWRDQYWLLRDYNIGYIYSATLLQMQQRISRQHRQQERRTRWSFGGYAPSYTATGIYQLQSTEAMVNDAKNLLGGTTWCAADANEATFKRTATKCRVLMLAMHGLADAENPERSRLLFGNPGPDSLENNNILYAAELQIMQLQADLVILSACHSGFGKLQRGEGVFSLARALARAGVPATVMSMWLLHETSAGPLMQGFLKYLKAGKSKDEALRLAKLDFLQDDAHFATTHPFFWAGVITSGDMCALTIDAARFNGWWLALPLLLLPAFAWWWNRKRQGHRSPPEKKGNPGIV